MEPTIYLEKSKDGESLVAVCSCGWEVGRDEPQTILSLGNEAIAHARETGHRLRGQ